MWRRNQVSMRLAAATRATLQPRRKAARSRKMRLGCGRASPAASASSSSPSKGASLPSAPKPARPVSSERSAFCRLSLKVRPMLIVSPTDFIWVPRVSSTGWNFSKVKRGILVTT